MTSDRKLAANRTNATKSKGPKSQAGKLRSSRNAVRHGLTAAVGSDPEACEEIEDLVKAFAVSNGNSSVESVNAAAHAQYHLQQIRKVRAALYANCATEAPLTTAALDNLNEALRKIENYERRAVSRRKRAFRALCRNHLANSDYGAELVK